MLKCLCPMQLSVRINCSVSIADRIEESVSRRLSSPSETGRAAGESDAQEITERYRRLLKVVLGNWWYTDWIVRAYLARRIDTTNEITLYDVGIEDDERDMISLILSRLDKDDADFFRRICDERWLLAQDDPFWDCFEFELSCVPKVEDSAE